MHDRLGRRRVACPKCRLKLFDLCLDLWRVERAAPGRTDIELAGRGSGSSARSWNSRAATGSTIWGARAERAGGVTAGREPDVVTLLNLPYWVSLTGRATFSNLAGSVLGAYSLRVAKRPLSRKPPGRHVGGRGRGRQTATGPGPDRYTRDEIEQISKRLRAILDEKEAVRELTRIVDRYEAWRAHQAERFRDALEHERTELASGQEQLARREQAQLRFEQKFDEEMKAREAELEEREAKVLPTEKLVAAQTTLNDEFERHFERERKLADAERAARVADQERLRTQRGFETAVRAVLANLQSAEDTLQGFSSQSSVLGWTKRSSAETVIRDALTRLQWVRHHLEQASSSVPTTPSDST